MWRRRGGVVAASTCSLVKKGSLAQERLSGWSAFSTSASNYSWRTSRTFAFSQIGRRSSIDHNLPLLIGVGAALCTSMMSTTRRIWCDEEAVTTQSLSAKLKQYSNVMFPVYKSKSDVVYWMNYFYCNPVADVLLVPLAIESLEKDGAFNDIQVSWMLTGFLAGLLKRESGEKISKENLKNIFNALKEQKKVLLVALWLAGDKGQKHLKRLSELSEDEETKELINTLAAKPPPDPLQSEFSVANLDMNMQILLGMFYASGDSEVVVKMAQGTEAWQTDVLAQDQDIDKFLTSKIVRDKLLQLTVHHPLAREICKQEYDREPSRLSKRERENLGGVIQLVDKSLGQGKNT